MSDHSSESQSIRKRLTKSKRRSNKNSVENFYSSYRKPKILQYATMKLLESTFPKLVDHIYSHSNHEAFRDPEIRVGICVKLLYSLQRQYDEETLKPIIEDIEYLMDSDLHLESTGDPDARRACLEEELHLVQRYIDIDDTITLNTDLGTEGEDQYVSRYEQANPEEGCLIM